MTLLTPSLVRVCLEVARSGIAEKRGRGVKVGVLVLVAVTAVVLCGLYKYSTVELRGQDLVQLLNNHHLSWTVSTDQTTL